MTEIHRVPLQPIAKGSVGKLWLGLAAIVLAGGGIAYAALPPAVDVDVIKAGSGASPTTQDVVLINYKGMLPGGKVFDQGERAPLQMTGVVPGFTKALEQMQRGGKYKVLIPAALAYGDKGAGDAIPPGTDLTFEIELLDFKSLAEIQQQQQMMEQLQQMQQQGGAGAQGVPGAGAPQMPGLPAPGELGPPPQP